MLGKTRGDTRRLNKISKKIRHKAPTIRIFLPTAVKKDYRDGWGLER